MNINRANSKDLPDILDLLKKCDLPVKGLAEYLGNFLVVKADGKILGCVGLEIYQDTGLLRSLAVNEEERGKGHGRLLVLEILNLAKKKKLKKVYLLTIDAADYFRRFDFRVISRDKVDSEIPKTLALSSNGNSKVSSDSNEGHLWNTEIKTNENSKRKQIIKCGNCNGKVAYDAVKCQGCGAIFDESELPAVPVNK